MKRYAAVLAGLSLAAALLAACGEESKSPSGTTPSATATTATTAIDPADFRAEVDNPLFPLTAGTTFVYEGEEVDSETGETIEIRIESTVLAETEIVGGVEVTVVEVKDYEDGELVEETRDYYAQHTDGTVYYFGERVDDYEGGEVVGHSGQWLAGEGDNQPGVFMPGDVAVGVEFEQERAPGVAEDRSKIVEVDQTVTTAAGTFSGCIKTEDFDPLGGVTEHKYYCTGVGLVREEPSGGGSVDLISY